MARRVLTLCSLTLLSVASGCWSRGGQTVVVYTALDSEFSQAILEDFSRTQGIAARPKFDTEATKTVGLTEAILAERDRPRCDVFWNNEILNTLRLQKAGLLESYHPPIAGLYPPMYRSAEGYWHGFAARARVLIVNTEMAPEAEWPRSIHDMAQPKWRGRCGIAKPLFGTTATHAACLFAHWGDERAKQFFRALKDNDVKILAGNKQVALSVGGGELAFGLTDTDDAVVELEKGMPIAIVYPDQQPAESGGEALGTLFIPNTLAILRGSPNPEAARRLVDYLLSPEVEKRLAEGRSAQIPLNPTVKADVRVRTPQEIEAMEVDFEAAAEKWDSAAQFIRDEFTGG